MSYLHPAYYRLLPPTARPQLIAFLQLVERNQHASADGWADLRQEVIARELGRTKRQVRRYELVCAGVGILQVEHHGRHNRRRLRLRSAKESLARNPSPRTSPLREWGHGCPHSGDTDVPTVDNSLNKDRARVSDEETSSTLRAAPAERAPRQAKEPAGRQPGAAVIRSTGHLVEQLGRRWQHKVAELVHGLVQLTSDKQVAGFCAIVSDRVGRVVDPADRAKQALKLLASRRRKLLELRRGGTKNALAGGPRGVRL